MNPDDLVAFLRARLDEDEAVARAAEPGPWSTNGYEIVTRADDRDLADVYGGGGSTPDHIARHDPARVLAEVEAKRRIIEMHETEPAIPEVYCDHGTHSPGKPAMCAACGYEEAPCPTLRLLAIPYADHPDYRQEWRP